MYLLPLYIYIYIYIYMYIYTPYVHIYALLICGTSHSAPATRRRGIHPGAELRANIWSTSQGCPLLGGAICPNIFSMVVEWRVGASYATPAVRKHRSRLVEVLLSRFMRLSWSYIHTPVMSIDAYAFYELWSRRMNPHVLLHTRRLQVHVSPRRGTVYTRI